MISVIQRFVAYLTSIVYRHQYKIFIDGTVKYIIKDSLYGRQFAKFGSLLSDSQRLYHRFITGETMALEMSNNIYKTIDLDNNSSYMDDIERVKDILDTCKKVFSKDVFYIKTLHPISEAHKHLIIRWINMCHSDKPKLIVINDVILYSTSNFRGFDEVGILTYILRVLATYDSDRRTRLIKMKEKRYGNRIGVLEKLKLTIVGHIT